MGAKARCIKKVCTRCSRNLPLTDFPPRRRSGDGRQSHCKFCNRERAAAWILKNPGRKYGLSPEEFNAILERGRCDICGTPVCDSGNRLAIDHDHVTGQVRGLLCRACNQGIGIFGEQPERLRSAADYLERAA